MLGQIFKTMDHLIHLLSIFLNLSLTASYLMFCS